MDDKIDIKQYIEDLRRRVEYHARRYYVLDDPEISDFEYDAMFSELQKLEAEHPELDSPTSQSASAAPFSKALKRSRTSTRCAH